MEVIATKATEATRVTEVVKKSYHKLFVWQSAHRFLLMVYKMTEIFPKTEMYGLTSQLRRAALSVPTNIVEGHSKKTRPDFLRYLDIAKASLTETEYLLEVSFALGYLSKDDYLSLESSRRETGYLLYQFINSMK
jgi:four helix bundle protein